MRPTASETRFLLRKAFPPTLRGVTDSVLRRGLAAGGVALFFFGSVVAPAVHLSEHHAVSVNVADIDIDALLDPQTGRVDLSRLAVELGMGEHDESRPHRHGPGPEHHHGEGSLEHFMLALASGSPVLAALPASPFEFVIRPVASPRSRVPALNFLSAQRAQAPPTSAPSTVLPRA